jgi:hypothetical protein
VGNVRRSERAEEEAQWIVQRRRGNGWKGYGGKETNYITG